MHSKQETDKSLDIYTAIRKKKWPAGITTSIVRLTPDQARRKTALLSGFIVDRWGDSSPKLGESIDQQAVEAYEAFIDPYVYNDLPIPTYQPKQDIAPVVPNGTKVCRACHQDKVLAEFYSHPKPRIGGNLFARAARRQQRGLGS